jgi:hypothetical protein
MYSSQNARWARTRLPVFVIEDKDAEKYDEAAGFFDRMGFPGGEWDVPLLAEGSVEIVKNCSFHCFFLRINQLYGLLPPKADDLYPADTS